VLGLLTAGAPDIAIGNVVGSNIFDVLFILGLSVVVAPGTGALYAQDAVPRRHDPRHLEVTPAGRGKRANDSGRSPAHSPAERHRALTWAQRLKSHRGQAR
jgi:hypothetical protein